MKLKITLLSISAFILLILVLFAYYIKPTTSGYYKYTGEKISEYRLYEFTYYGNVNCDSIYSFSIIYEDDDTYYTTSDLESGGNCFSSYYITEKGEIYSLYRAHKDGLISIEDLTSFNFDITIIERVKFHNPEDVIKVEYYSNTEDSLDTKTTLSNRDDLDKLVSEFKYLLFNEEIIVEEKDVLYYLDIYTNEDVITYGFYEDMIIELSTGKVVKDSDMYIPTEFIEDLFALTE